MFSLLFVCLLALCAKISKQICMKFSAKVKFRWRYIWPSGISGIVFRIRHYWEIQKVVNGHKSAVHTDSPDGDTGKTCLGRGVHCPCASSLSIFHKQILVYFQHTYKDIDSVHWPFLHLVHKDSLPIHNIFQILFFTLVPRNKLISQSIISSLTAAQYGITSGARARSARA